MVEPSEPYRVTGHRNIVHLNPRRGEKEPETTEGAGAMAGLGDTGTPQAHLFSIWSVKPHFRSHWVTGQSGTT